MTDHQIKRWYHDHMQSFSLPRGGIRTVTLKSMWSKLCDERIAILTRYHELTEQEQEQS